jgi:pyruvate formate lyase activating enzyme
MTQGFNKPLIFDIHRYALDDGPGIRTTVFFKGCPLECVWCHNPEGIKPEPELYCQAEKCINCGDCVANCPLEAISLGDHIDIDRASCDVCGKCADQCLSGALSIKGRYYPARELMDILLKDKRFFDHSGGGVTFSGGEPTLYPDYLKSVIDFLKDCNVHVAIQTCGHFDWSLFQRNLLSGIDLIYFDLKCIDPHLHQQWTGRSNRRILDNFSRLVNVAQHKVVCTIPLIPGYTAQKDNVQKLARFAGDMGVVSFSLHPYNPGIWFKAPALGRTITESLPVNAMSPDEYNRIVEEFTRRLHSSGCFYEA